MNGCTKGSLKEVRNLVNDEDLYSLRLESSLSFFQVSISCLFFLCSRYHRNSKAAGAAASSQFLAEMSATIFYTLFVSRSLSTLAALFQQQYHIHKTPRKGDNLGSDIDPSCNHMFEVAISFALFFHYKITCKMA